MDPDDRREWRLRHLETEELARLTDVEAHRLASLGESARAVALRRLAVLRAWCSSERKELFDGAEDAARAARLSRRSLFNLVRDRSTSDVLAFGGGRAAYAEGVAADAGDRATLLDEAMDAFARDPSARSNDVAARLASHPSVRASRSTLSRVIAEARRRTAGFPAFGNMIALDSAGLDAVDATGRIQRLFAALDVETGLLLSWEVAPDASIDQAYADVARRRTQARGDALPAADLYGLAVATGVRTRQASMTRAGGFWFSQALVEAGWTLELDARRCGSRIVGALGRGLADLSLSVGFAGGSSTSKSASDALRPLDEACLAGVRAAISEHNRARLARLPRSEGESGGDARALTDDALAGVDAAANAAGLL